MGLWDWVAPVVGGTLGFLFGGPAGAVAGAALFSKPGQKLINSVLDFVLQPFLGNMDTPATSDPGQQGMLVTRQGTDKDIPVIYGYRKAGGIITFAETGSTDNKYLWVAYVFSEGVVEGLNELWIDDNPLSTDTVKALNAGQTVNVQDGKYKDRTVMRWFPGVYYTTPSASPVASDVAGNVFSGAPSWDSKMIYNGLAVLFCRFEWKKATTQAEADNNPFTGGIPNVQAGILGRKVIGLATKKYNADGSLDGTASATMLTNVDSYWNSNTVYDRNAGRYSTNPVEILFDYLRNPQYGKGMQLGEIDKTTWVNAANKCNQIVTYYTGAQGPILTCNYILETNVTLFNNVKYLLSGFRAYMPYVQGKYKLKIEDAGNETDITSGVATIVDTITKNEIVGDITYTGIERTAKYNQVVVTYVDPDQKWSAQQAVWPQTEAERQVYIAEDGGRENKSEITFNTITNSIMALDMARLIFNKSRYQESCSVKISALGFEYEPGDNIYIQGNVLNFGTTPWRIISIRMNTDYTFDVSCVRNPDNIYPYAKYNQPDVVRSPYIPKGNEIYWPGVGTPLIGIFPPAYAQVPGTYVPTSSNPLPTNPNDPTNPGGGIGGSTGSTSNGTITTGTVPITPPVVTYDAAVKFLSSFYNATTNSFVVTFGFDPSISTKPATYAGLKWWYKPNTITNYYPMTDVGPGETTLIIPAATTANVQYTIITRVKYDNGQISTRKSQITIGQNVSATGLVSFSDVVGPFDPTQITIQKDVINKDADISLDVYSVSGGLPKVATFTVFEPTLAYPATGLTSTNKMTTINVYYRPTAPAGVVSQYYYTDSFTLPASWVPNQKFTFPITLIGTTTTDYEVIFRWVFNDGSLGNRISVNNINVSSVVTGATSNNFNLAYTEKDLTKVQTSGTTVSTIAPTVNSIYGSQGNMIISIKDPTTAPESLTNFIGVSVDIAKVTSGGTIAYNNVNFTLNNGLTAPFGGGSYIMNLGPISFAVYNVIIRLAYYSAGTTQYMTKAVKYFGSFDGTNALSQMTFLQSGDYTALISDQGTSKGGGPKVIPTSIIDAQPPASGATSTSNVKVPSFIPYFTLGTGITGVRIYRSAASGKDSNYNNIGPFRYEYTDVTVSGTRIRYAASPKIAPSGYPYASTNPLTQTLYFRAITSSGLANEVIMVTPQQGGNSLDIMKGGPTPFLADNNTYDLTATVNSALNAALTASHTGGNTQSNTIAYNVTDLGWTTGTIT